MRVIVRIIGTRETTMLATVGRSRREVSASGTCGPCHQTGQLDTCSRGVSANTGHPNSQP